MKFSKKIYYGISSAIPTTIIKKLAPPSALCPYHHVVSDEDLLHIKHLYPYKNTKQFRQDLDYLLKHYKPITAATVVASISEGKKIPKNSFLLSFDDGFREAAEIIAPILLEKGVPAIFFLNPAFIDNQKLYYRCGISLLIDELIRQKSDHSIVSRCAKILQIPGTGNVAVANALKKINNLNQHLLIEVAHVLEVDFDGYLKKQKPFMSTEQLNFLVSNGFDLGGHSWDHPYYQLLSMSEKIEQTVSSCQYIRDNFAENQTLFSFPHTDQGISQSFFTNLSKQIKIDLFFGTQNQDEELTNKVLHRFNAERPDVSLRNQLNGLLLWMLFRKLSHTNKIVRI